MPSIFTENDDNLMGSETLGGGAEAAVVAAAVAATAAATGGVDAAAMEAEAAAAAVTARAARVAARNARKAETAAKLLSAQEALARAAEAAALAAEEAKENSESDAEEEEGTVSPPVTPPKSPGTSTLLYLPGGAGQGAGSSPSSVVDIGHVDALGANSAVHAIIAALMASKAGERALASLAVDPAAAAVKAKAAEDAKKAEVRAAGELTFMARCQIRALKRLVTPLDRYVFDKWKHPSARGELYPALMVVMDAIDSRSLTLESSVSLQTHIERIAELALSAPGPLPLGVLTADIIDLGSRIVSGTASKEESGSVLVRAAVELREESDRAVFALLRMHATSDSPWASAIESAASRFRGLDGKGSGDPYACQLYFLAQEVRAAWVVAPVSVASLLDDERHFTARNPVDVKGGSFLAGMQTWELNLAKLSLALANAGIPSSLMAGKAELFIDALPPSELKSMVVEATKSWALMDRVLDVDGRFVHFRAFAAKLDEKAARRPAVDKTGGGTAATAVAAAKAAAAAAAVATAKAAKAEKAAKAAPLRANAAVASMCFNCGEKGHLSRECDLPQEGLRCYTCKEVGHRSKDCPKRVPSVGAGNV